MGIAIRLRDAIEGISEPDEEASELTAPQAFMAGHRCRLRRVRFRSDKRHYVVPVEWTASGRIRLSMLGILA
jgi:hypothetical protein